jgi:hypothetical protein
MFEPGSFGDMELPVVCALRSMSRETTMLPIIIERTPRITITARLALPLMPNGADLPGSDE